MRKTILTAVAVLAIGGATAGTLIAEAQPAPPAPPPSGAQGPAHMGWMGWMHHAHEWQRREGWGPISPLTFALVYPQADRKLTPPDVQKIAEAFLLWRGNHSWKVVNVAPAADGAIGFSLATQEGSVIASFTMDPHTGRLTRTG